MTLPFIWRAWATSYSVCSPSKADWNKVFCCEFHAGVGQASHDASQTTLQNVQVWYVRVRHEQPSVRMVQPQVAQLVRGAFPGVLPWCGN